MVRMSAEPVVAQKTIEPQTKRALRYAIFSSAFPGPM
jgi:hypothetical protein